MPPYRIFRAQRMNRAASKIQYFWRMWCRTTYSIVKQQQSSGMTIEKASSITFDSLQVVLREPLVVNRFTAALYRIHVLTTYRHGHQEEYSFEINVRVVLAAFMIVCRPTEVFDSVGAVEQALIDSAVVLVTLLEKIYSNIMASKHHSFAEVPNELTVNFIDVLFKYLKCFKTWKLPDEAKLACRIKWALIALYDSRGHLSPDEPENSKISIELCTQTEKLRSKLCMIAGVDALREFDEKRQAGAPFAVPPSGCKDKGGVGVYATLPGRVSNQQLVHELLLDSLFQINDKGGCAIENTAYEKIRITFERAYWDSLVDDLKQRPIPCYVRVFRILSEISDAIKDMSNQRDSEKIDEVIDLDLIKQRVDFEQYGIDCCLHLVNGIIEVIRRVQTPNRDESLNAEWPVIRAGMETAAADDHESVFCKALEFILNRVNLMRIDCSNSRLRLISPVIKAQGIVYERERFDDKLKEGTLTLERTTCWIDKAIAATNVSTLDAIIQGMARAEVHADALFSLISSPVTICVDTLPETLLFDTYHLVKMQREIKYLTDAATMVVALASAAPRAALVIKSFVELLFSKDKVMDLEDTETVARIDNELMGIEDEGARSNARSAIFRCIKPSDPVKQIMQLRVKRLLRSMMTMTLAAKDVMLVIQPLFPRFVRTMAKINQLAAVNWTVHIQTYNTLIMEAAVKVKK